MVDKKDIISYDVAILLSKKGYTNKVTDMVYNNKLKHLLPWTHERFVNDLYIPAPTIYEVQKWIREEYNLNIVVRYYNDLLWVWSIYHCNNAEYYEDEDNMSMFNTYEEALNNGIKKALMYI